MLDSLNSIVSKVTDSRFSYKGFLEGEAGKILFLSEYSKYFRNEEINQNLDISVKEMQKTITSASLSHDYANGLSGICTILALMRKYNQINIDLDSEMYSAFKKTIDQKRYELFFGSLGYLMFFLYRTGSTRSRFLPQMIKAIYQIKQQTTIGIYWESYHRKTFDRNFKDFGIAHGMAAIIGVFAEIYSKDLGLRNENEIIDEIYSFYKDNVNSTQNCNSIFPYGISSRNQIDKDCRLAWCYGDAGIGLTFMLAGYKIDNYEIFDYGKTILLNAARRRKLELCKVTDPYFCHGSAGLAIIFLNAYKLTKNMAFQDSANYWMKITLNFLNENKYSRTSFLTGLSGVGLVLLSFLHEENLEWEKLVLIN